ncbi:hypothetical protein JV46_21450 [Solemya velum gill symbiont]|uniref:Uncharacterized protein n=1 Tax=Solemya velum gill symbiont TaxID=2340 RepID=A0A0B0H7H9_SOVGS|nr:hypothetical protein JV46_21450 [Solemya velum gill symbiont]
MVNEPGVILFILEQQKIDYSEYKGVLPMLKREAEP